MKKNLFRVLACVMALAMVLSLTACGGKDDASSKSPASSAAESKPASEPASEPASSAASDEPASTPASSEAGTVATGKYASVSEFLADPEVSGQLEAMMSALGDDMNIDVSGEGDKLVYTFTFTEELSEDIESIASAMEEEMTGEDFASTFEGIAASLSDAIEVTNPSVVVTYKAVDGTEIYSHEYFPAE